MEVMLIKSGKMSKINLGPFNRNKSSEQWLYFIPKIKIKICILQGITCITIAVAFKKSYISCVGISAMK